MFLPLLFLISISAARNVNISSSCSKDASCVSQIRSAFDCYGCSITITLGPGTFILTADTQVIGEVYGLTQFVFQGAGSTQTILKMTKLNGLFLIGNSANLRFSGFSISLERAPFTTGVAVSSNTLAIDPAYYPIDVVKHPWLLTAQTISRYQNDRGFVNPELYFWPYPSVAYTAGNTRATFYGWNMEVNQTYILRHRVYSHHLFTLMRISGSLRFVDVEMNFGAGMGIATLYSENVELDRVTIKPLSGYPMSLTADGVHMTNVIGSLTIKNCRFIGQGDDAVNVGSAFFRITGISPDRTHIYVQGNNDVWAGHFFVGHWINILTQQQQWKASHAVLSVNANDWRLNAAVPASVAVGDLIYDAASVASPILITSNTFMKNRARGVLVRGWNMQITDNTFYQTSGPAVLLATEACYWFEGIASSNVLISRNSISFANGGPAQTLGSISIFGESMISSQCTQNSPYPIFNNVTITQNTIATDTPFRSVHVGQTILLLISNNVFTRTGSLTGKEISLVESYQTTTSPNTCNGLLCS